MKTSTKVTYKKLRNGDWGIVGPENMIAQGAVVDVHKASGEVKTEVVGRVIWTGNGVSIASIVKQSRSYSRGDGGPRGDRPCYMCGSYYCEGARGGLCDDD